MSGAAAGRRGVAWWRLPLLLFALVALVAGVGAGLARLAWPMPAPLAGAAALHGPLLVCGFFGTVISLERAVAVGHRWAYAAPLACGLGTAAAMHGFTAWSPWLSLAGAAGLLLATLDVWRRQREAFVAVITIAAACFVAGTAGWAAGAPVWRVVPWWLAFLVLTIAGERLELSRLMPPTPAARRAFAAVVAAMLLALAWHALGPPPGGERLFGGSLLALAAWLVLNDIARRTVRQRGLTRYIAVCLLSGYFWLALGGAVVLAAGLEPGSRAYDAALHALLVGFVFSMVFGHAPVIAPAVLRVSIAYTPWFYAPLALLHAALTLRVAGDAAGSFALTRWGALLSAVALAAFLASTAAAVLRARRRR